MGLTTALVRCKAKRACGFEVGVTEHAGSPVLDEPVHLIVILCIECVAILVEYITMMIMTMMMYMIAMPLYIMALPFVGREEIRRHLPRLRLDNESE